MRKMFVVPTLLCALVATAPRGSVAGGPPQPKCAAGKQKAAAKKENSKLICNSTAIKKIVPVDPLCLQTAETAFNSAFATSDAIGGAPCTGLASTIEGTVDACVQHIIDALPVAPGQEKCESGKVKAAGKAALKKLICHSKATKKGGHCSTTIKTLCIVDNDCPASETCVLTPVDPACLSGVSTLLSTLFTAADSKGACPGTASSIDALIDASCVNDVVPQLPARDPGCGNNVVEGYLGETCDDGNTVNGDGCPASCHVDSCTAMAGSSFLASVQYTPPAGTTISGLQIFVDYPEGKVAQPTFSSAFGVNNQPFDLGYGFNDSALKLGGLPSTFLHMNFKTCQGATVASAADFQCTVTEASNDVGDPVDPATVSCTVTVP